MPDNRFVCPFCRFTGTGKEVIEHIKTVDCGAPVPERRMARRMPRLLPITDAELDREPPDARRFRELVQRERFGLAYMDRIPGSVISEQAEENEEYWRLQSAWEGKLRKKDEARE